MSPTAIAFWLFVLSLSCYVFLLTRVVRRLDQLGPDFVSETEALSQLILSGGGGIRNQLNALQYVLRRKYAEVGDQQLLRAGDRARLGFFVTLGCMLIWMVLLLVLSR